MSKSIWSLNDVASQKGKVAVVTGANTGLSYETVKALVVKSIKVIMACRNMEKAEGAARKANWHISFFQLNNKEDLSKLDVVLFLLLPNRVYLIQNLAGMCPNNRC